MRGTKSVIGMVAAFAMLVTGWAGVAKASPEVCKPVKALPEVCQPVKAEPVAVCKPVKHVHVKRVRVERVQVEKVEVCKPAKQVPVEVCKPVKQVPVEVCKPVKQAPVEVCKPVKKIRVEKVEVCKPAKPLPVCEAVAGCEPVRKHSIKVALHHYVAGLFSSPKRIAHHHGHETVYVTSEESNTTAPKAAPQQAPAPSPAPPAPAKA